MDRPWIPKRKHKPFTKDKELLKFYNSSTWRKLSKMIRQRDPICKICNNRLSQVADHIIPISQGGDKYDMDNLQGVCHKCHNKKSQSERK